MPLYLAPGPEISQGDIYLDIPSVVVEARPLRVARVFDARQRGEPRAGARQTYGVHLENGDPPRGGFHWTFDRGGEEILVRAHLATAMLISHDCEIDYDHRHRTVAIVRPITDIQPEHRAALLRGDEFSAFPLEAQEEEPAMPTSFVDFRRVTTVRPEVLQTEPSRRVASLSAELRKALAEHYWNYLHRRAPGPREHRE